MRIKFLLASCIAATLPLAAQGQPEVPVPAANPAEAKALTDVARAVRSLDAVLEQIQAAQESARTALEAARSAEANAKHGDLERVMKVAVELQVQLEALNAAVAERLGGLLESRKKAAAEVPVAWIDTLMPLREKVLATLRMPSLADAEAQLMQVEEELAGDGLQNTPGVGPLLALARYRLADTWSQRADVEIRAKKDKVAEKSLASACLKFAEVADGVDNVDSGEGSSLKAVARRRIVQIETSLYEGYRKLSRLQPNVKVHATNAEKHKQAAADAFDALRRASPDATLPDGTSVVEAARRDVDRITGH